MALKDKDMTSPASMMFLLSSMNQPKSTPPTESSTRPYSRPRTPYSRPNVPGGNKACDGDHCYICGDKGHWARNCPKKDSSDSKSLIGAWG